MPIVVRRAISALSDPDVAPEVAQVTRTAWNVGQISRNHGLIADRCENCHARPFTPVRNDECLKCHASVGAHVPHETPTDLAHERCTACHQEHRGDGALTSFGDRLCVGCHADLHAVAPNTVLGDARGFATLHPEFRPLVIGAGDDATPQRVSLLELLRPGQPASGHDKRERSGLAFSHRKHLQPGLRSPIGPAMLKCESCHTLEAGGALLRKVSFAQHCQGCHSLAFADGHPERQAPHADPATVRLAIFEYYAARALEGSADTVQTGTAVRRRPGGELSEPEREAALGWAAQRADEASALLLGSSGACAQCHVSTGDAGELHVAPVRLMPLQRDDRWLPFASFTHAPLEHRECESCHDAAAADSAEVVILPGIDKCRACHGDENAAAGKVASRCLTCHAFHQRSFGPMQSVAASAHEGAR
jgi:predicted CXXCH cytochrome family protein